MRWTVVIPYFNEESFLPATLASLSAQTLQPARVILVDNASTDRSAEVARNWAEQHPELDVVRLEERRPGVVRARQLATPHIDSEFVAFWDGDTMYPPAYLQTADMLFRQSDQSIVGYIAHSSNGLPDSAREKFSRYLYSYIISRILTHQVHSGGYGHVFRSYFYKSCGGYDHAKWPYVLNDHELPHRLWKLGAIRMHPGFWVQTSLRRSDRKAVRWTLGERILYHATLPFQKDWFFYRFLQPRFAARGQKDTVLRQQSWAPPAG